MTVTVFGAAGFVGRAVVAKLHEKGEARPVLVDLPPNPFGAGADYRQADMLDAKAVREAVKGATAVIHLAAHPLNASMKDPLENARVNILGLLTILDACRAEGVKKVVFSSASSLAGTPKYNPVDEDHPATPKTPYGVAKLACEHYLRVYQELYGLDYLVFRFYNVYGPGQLPTSGALIPVVLQKLKNGEPITVFGDGSSARDFIFVDDVADLLVRATGPEPKNEVVNLGTGRLTSVREVAEICGKATGKVPKYDIKPARPGEISNFSADTQRLHKLFDRVSFTPVEQGVARTAAWLARQG